MVLASSLADCVLTDAILISPRPPIPPTIIMKVRGLQKSTETSSRKTITTKRRCRDDETLLRNKG